MNDITEAPSKRGGKREGAGRPKRTSRQVELWMKARGIRAATAAEVLAHMDERRLWHRLLNSEEDRVVLDAVKFLTTMRDGKPVQQLNITSANVNISADDIAKARMIASQLSPNLGLSIADGANSFANSSPLLGEAISPERGGKGEDDKTVSNEGNDAV